MGKVKKLVSLSEDAVKKLEILKTNNPELSVSGIIEAIVMNIPDNTVIKRQTKIEYTVQK